MDNEFQGDKEFCCFTFIDLVNDARIQLSPDGNVIIWTCEGNVGEYPTFGHPQCDGIKYCPFCGASV